MPVTQGCVNVMRTATIFVLGLLVLACNGSGGATADETTGTTAGGSVDGSSTTTTGGPACTLGTEGCACNEGTCGGELSCYSQICVMPPALESSGSGETSAGSESSGASPESSSTVGETTSGSDSESSSTGSSVEECEEEGNHVCEDDVLDTCEEGEVVSQSCADNCAQTGFFTTGCADANGCNCDGYADEACATITGKFCSCQFGGSCDEQLEVNVYKLCFDPTINEAEHDLVVCFGDFPTDTFEECNAAADVCYNL